MSPASPEMSTYDAAIFFGLASESGLYKWVATGTIPARCYWRASPRGRLRFKRSECEKWKMERT